MIEKEKNSKVLNTGILEIDVHGMTCEQAKRVIDSQIERAAKGTYRIRIIHGFHGGTGIKQMIREEYSYRREDRVLRVQGGQNEGITELILREF